jgi:3-deoxy-alpha-D-manno-octulosonate 8-oxidase
MVFIVDHFFMATDMYKRLPIESNDMYLYLDTTNEPTTAVVDDYVRAIIAHTTSVPGAIIGIGGGSVMDVAKAVAVVLTNGGSAQDYQGWNLVKSPAAYKIGIPTIAGTGSEVSRTTVLTGTHKKQGINSDYSLFNQIVLDPELLATVPTLQRFYTGMDCYIHCVEAISGTFLNEFSKAFAQQALKLCDNVFLDGGSNADLMVASYMGGCSIVYSEVGVCHALSYGISYAFKVHHGLANCLVFNHLDEYYPEYVSQFKVMLKQNNITLPSHLFGTIDDATMEKMIDMTLLMEKPLHNALGANWKTEFTRDVIRLLYNKITEQPL